MIDGVTGGHLWADRYDRDLTDIFAIQDEITRTIVDELKVQLLPQERAAIVRPETDDVDAYADYLKGRTLFHNATKQHIDEARAYLQRAIERDPNYAKAYAALAVVEFRRNEYHGAGVPVGDILALADRAIAIDPTLASAHAARGVALGNNDEDEGARLAFERALELDPDSHEANLWYAHFLMSAGQLERSAAMSIRALEIDPEDFVSPLFAETVLRGLGRMDESRRYGEMGIIRAEEAALRNPDISRPAQLLATTHAAMGKPDEARLWLARALAIDSDDNLVRYNAACAYAQMGDHERALDLLDRWSKSTGRQGFGHARQDPDLEPLRSHPRFASILDHAREGAAS